jgi:hypothetical protein
MSDDWRMSSEARWKPKMSAARFSVAGAAAPARAVVGVERVDQHCRSAENSAASAYGSAWPTSLRRMLVARARGRGQAGVDADQGAAVGLVGAVVGGVRRLVGQRLQFRRQATIRVEIDSSAPSVCTSSR